MSENESNNTPLIESFDLEEEKPESDIGKTPEQILESAGVTQADLDKVFPPEYEPLTKHPREMTREEIKKRAQESLARFQTYVKNSDSEPMPSPKEIIEKYAKEAGETIKVGGEEGLNLALDGLLAALESAKQKNTQGPASEARLQFIEEVRQNINEMMELEELERFDVKSARKIWLEKIKERSRFKEVMLCIKHNAEAGKSEVQFSYLSQYDEIRLSEMGFAISKVDGRPLDRLVSWEVVNE